jgi:hypothetical protein
MAGLLSLCRSATLRLGVFALNSFAPIDHPKMNTGKEPFQCGMRNAECGERPSSLPSSLRYDAASCFDAARSAEFGNGERDRPGCRFRRRAENPSTNSFVQRWFGRDARTRTRDARAPPNRPYQNENRKRAVQERNSECGCSAEPVARRNRRTAPTLHVPFASVPHPPLRRLRFLLFLA